MLVSISSPTDPIPLFAVKLTIPEVIMFRSVLLSPVKLSLIVPVVAVTDKLPLFVLFNTDRFTLVLAL